MWVVNIHVVRRRSLVSKTDKEYYRVAKKAGSSLSLMYGGELLVHFQ